MLKVFHLVFYANIFLEIVCRFVDPNFNSLIPIYTGCDESEDFSPCLFDCRKFYRCANGYKSIYNCPDGTAFSTDLKICIHSPLGLCTTAQNSGHDSLEAKGYNFKNESKKDIKNEILNSKTTVSVSNSKAQNEKLIKTTTTTSEYLSNVCIYTFTDFERSIFCQLKSFKKTNPNCC
ncbi:unnamed protein product [Brachionus calyciflorus]|uniref:Chitin-binding type-2 domain-containing protein n=1 Tax=Brachionus calyciflorus TaxID=104777 RepID=A0A813YMB7_9BILA|nr:unnamed protein product [Brachionus calyciflorus]